MDNKLYWVWFQIMFGYGSARSHDLLTAFESPKKIYEEIESGNTDFTLLTIHEQSFFKGSFDKAKQIIDTTLRKKCDIITPDDSDYPERLRHIYGKPAALYVRGNLAVLKDNLAFAIVGARKNTKYGAKATEFITEGLSAYGTTIISGLALGIDSIALDTALKNGTSAVGALACGLDYDYPKGSNKLKTAISQNGAVISEYPMGTRPMPQMFPVRNRIMSGMANGVIIIEASDKSGALITAKTAFEQDREVYAVPGGIFSGTFLGSHNLVKDGVAKLVNSPLEVLMDFPEFECMIKGEAIKKTEIAQEKPKKPLRKTVPEGMDEIYYKIYNAVDETAKTTNEIALITDTDIKNVLGAVTTLELIGLIKILPGGFFTLA